MTVKRWRDTGVMVADEAHGWWVTYDDHLAAVAEVLQAARDAVAAITAYDDTEYSGQVVVQSVALAAIDALRGDRG